MARQQPLSDATSKALSALLNADVFHSAMLLDMELFETEELHGKPFPTAATDGMRKIWVNPTFMADMTPSQGAFVLAHEIEHKLLLYPCRFKELMARNVEFSPQLFNVAQDFLINAQLDHAGYPVKQLSQDKGSFTVQEFVDNVQAQILGQNAGADHKGGFMFDPSVRENQTSESIYNALIKALPEMPDKNGGGIAGGNGDDVIMDEFDNTCKEEGLTAGQAQQQMENEIVAAAQAAAARDPGSIPSHVRGMLETYAKPKTNWRAKLRQFISGRARDDWSLRRPNRRGGMVINGQTVLRHSLESETVGLIGVVVDTSGSVSDAELQQGLAEIQSICKRVKPREITVLSVDAEVNAVHTYKAGQQIPTMDTSGRGGTNMEPGFEFFKDNNLKPDAVICFTDNELCWPETKTVDCPLLVAVCNDRDDAHEVPHYAKAIRIDLDE